MLVSTPTARRFITYSFMVLGSTTQSALTLLPTHQYGIPQLLQPLLKVVVYHYHLSHHQIRVMIVCPVLLFTHRQSMLSKLQHRPSPHLPDQVLLLMTRYSVLHTLLNTSCPLLYLNCCLIIFRNSQLMMESST